MASQARASSARIRRHWEVLCREIGHRSAGSEGERRAADYIASQMRKHGLDDVTQQSFTFPGWTSSRCTLRVGPTRPTRPVHSARASVYSVATPGGGVQGKLAYLQSGLPDDFHQPLRGRIGLLIGALPLGDEQVKQRLARSGLKALLNVDTRVPFAWPTSNGAAPQWVDGYHLPTAGLAYADAVALAEQMPLAAHLNMRTRCLPDTSQNVLGQGAGWEHPDQVIVVSGHHDCVDETVGADDNGSGVIFMLELARLFARRRVRRTIRFVSYGVEERLSVGSYVHMLSLTPAQRRQVVLAINADAVSSTVGSDVVRVTGTDTATPPRSRRACTPIPTTSPSTWWAYPPSASDGRTCPGGRTGSCTASTTTSNTCPPTCSPAPSTRPPTCCSAWPMPRASPYPAASTPPGAAPSHARHARSTGTRGIPTASTTIADPVLTCLSTGSPVLRSWRVPGEGSEAPSPALPSQAIAQTGNSRLFRRRLRLPVILPHRARLLPPRRRLAGRRLLPC